MIKFYIKAKTFERPPKPWHRGRLYDFDEVERMARSQNLRISRDGSKRITLFSGEQPIIHFHGTYVPDPSTPATESRFA